MGIGCDECQWTGYLDARDERGLTVTWPCDCRKKPQPQGSQAGDKE
jgi:hypothetical protein